MKLGWTLRIVAFIVGIPFILELVLFIDGIIFNYGSGFHWTPLVICSIVLCGFLGAIGEERIRKAKKDRREGSDNAGV